MHRSRTRIPASSPPSAAVTRSLPARAAAASLPVAVALALALAAAAAVGGCASAGSAPPPVARGAHRPPPPPPAPAAPVLAAPDSVSAEEAADLAALQAERYVGPVGSSNADLDDELEEFLSDESHAILTERVDFDIPIVINERVEYYVDYFQNRVRRSFAKWLARAPHIVPHLRARFRQEGLPEDLIYISLIESGFSPLATSRANAVGYWQFIAATGRRYGLRIDRWVDERRDLERSTEAAIAYLKDLHEMFGSWYLAAAAYNSGEGRIQRAIQRYGSEDLWELSEFSYLREETKDYVPKLIAATLIAREPERYGFGALEPLPPTEVDHVGVPPGTDLRRVASAARTSLETIRTLNPHLRSSATPPGDALALRVPRGAGAGFAERFAAAPAPRVPAERTHVVRRGESPSSIARRYGVPARELMALNGVRDPRRLRAGQRLRLPPPPGGGPEEEPAGVASTPEPLAGWPGAAPEAVEPDSARTSALAGAPAARAGGGSSPLPAAMAPAVRPPAPPGADAAGAPMPATVRGERADAPPGEPAATEGAAAPDAAPAALTVPVRYRVRPDDTIYGIARRHGLSVADVERANPGALAGLAPGQVLVLGPPTGPAREDGRSRTEPPPEGAVVHRVAPGDTLWSIARRHGVTAEDVRRWNDLDGTEVEVGQRLVLFPAGS